MRLVAIVPVYNAIEFTLGCLKSVWEAEYEKKSIVVVDDGSILENQNLLKEFCKEKPEITLVINDENLGYTKSINIGIKTALDQNPSFVSIINSDCEVARDFFLKTVPLLESSRHMGIVGPLSNAASHQSIPFVHTPDNNAFSTNSDLIEKYDLSQINAMLVDICSEVGGPPPTVTSLYNGFCSVIKAEVFRDVGLFDEDLFPIGYGEETDFALRAEDAGWICQICLDTFVTHHKSKSFGSERRKQLAKAGHEKLRSRYSYTRMKTAEKSISLSPQIQWVRQEFLKRCF